MEFYPENVRMSVAETKMALVPLGHVTIHQWLAYKHQNCRSDILTLGAKVAADLIFGEDLLPCS